jgi:tRNA (guanine37-N1)-methyltransferase
MRFHIITIFPEFFVGPLDFGVVAKARQAGRVEILIHDLRNWTYDRHRTVDDRPFGGGEGMLLKPQPLFEAVEAVLPERNERNRVVMLSAQGRLFGQPIATEYSKLDELVLLCGRYEGVDERVAEHLADEEISIGDFVLSGGELGAAVIVDSVARLLPGVLGNEESARNESFCVDNGGLLDCPQYTRPAEFRGLRVPKVLLGGNHAEIRRWRRTASQAKTQRLRPDLFRAGDSGEKD